MLKPYKVVIDNGTTTEQNVVVLARHPEEAFEQALLELNISHNDVILGTVKELEAGGAYVN